MSFQQSSQAPRWWLGLASALFVATAVLRIAAAPGVPVQAPAAARAQQPEFFEERIRPVLFEVCGECHVDDDEGGLTLDSREAMLKGGDTGPAIVPGDPDKSLLMHVIRRDEGFPRMPKSAPKLADDKIAAFAEWIKAGAPWPRGGKAMPSAPTASGSTLTAEQRAWWSFQPLAHPAAPPVKNGEW